MGRQRELRDAEQEVEETRVKCVTCENVALEGDKHCLSCGLYWRDVANGMYDEYADE